MQVKRLYLIVKLVELLRLQMGLMECIMAVLLGTYLINP